MGNLNIKIALVQKGRVSEAIKESVEIAKIVGKSVKLNIGLGEDLVIDAESAVNDLLRFVVLMVENKKLKETNAGLTNANKSLRLQMESGFPPKKLKESKKIKWVKVLKRRIEDIEHFNSWTKNALMYNEIYIVADLFEYNEEELLKLRRVGRKSLTQVIEYLKEEINEQIGGSDKWLGNLDVKEYLSDYYNSK